MAYITTEQVKNFRKEIKKAFPSQLGWKFSITKRNYSSIVVSIMEAPIELRSNSGLEKGDRLGNACFHNSYVNDFGKEVCSKISDIINVGNYDRSDSMTDYYDVGWYTTIHLGQWDKVFQVSNKKMNPKYLQGAA